MITPDLLSILGIAGATLAGSLALYIRRSILVAQPDEWLLRIRDGRLIEAGVGISLIRRPGDVVTRFSSTVQRVAFSGEAVSRDRLTVALEGFILWTVASEGEGPFKAFRKLGIVNLDAPSPELKSRKHLLTGPQHRAFRTLLFASLQRLAASMTLEDLLLKQDDLVAGFRERLKAFEADLGIRVEQVEILHIRPADAGLLKDLSARIEEEVREQAAVARLETSERTKQWELESSERLAADSAAAKRAALERERALKLDMLAHERERKEREQQMAREQRLAEESANLEIARAAEVRRNLEHQARLDRTRSEAEAQRDAILAVGQAEESKSPAAREHELARYVAEKVTEALGKLPLRDASWVTLGNDSPLASLGGIFAAARSWTEQSARPGAVGIDPSGKKALRQ